MARVPAERQAAIVPAVEIPSAESLVERPRWIGHEEPIFAVYHPPAEAHRRSKAVLFCAPFGNDDWVSYPVRRVWAQRLAAAGHPVLRFDLAGTGQSAGGPEDADLVRRWLRSIEAAAAWLRSESAASTVAAIGLGLGALLAREAATDESTSIDELVLWGLPRTGKQLTRRIRVLDAAARLFAHGSDQSLRDEPGLPPGWIVDRGYPMSAETVAAIDSLPGDKELSARIGRVLLLEPDKEQPTASGIALVERLRERGVVAEVRPGPGYAKMHLVADSSVVPDESVLTVEAWLGAGQTTTVHAPERNSPPVAAIAAEPAAGVRESLIALECGAGTLFGVYAEPSDDQTTVSDVCMVCLTPLAQRCIGPDRLWVEMARRQAAGGVPVLRVDLASIGESEGRRELVRADFEFVFEPGREAQVVQVLDALEARHGWRRFIIAGNCSASALAHEVGTYDERIVGFLTASPLPSPADEAKLVYRASALALRTRYRAVRAWSLMRRLLAGEVALLRKAAKRLARRPGGRDDAKPHGDEVNASHVDDDAVREGNAARWRSRTLTEVAKHLGQRGGLLVVACPKGDPTTLPLKAAVLARAWSRSPALWLRRIPSDSTTFRPRDKRALHGFADELVGEIIRRARDQDSPPAHD